MEFDEGALQGDAAGADGTAVTVEHCEEKAYSVVNVRCRDRPKLLFDIVCTLTDMQYVVFHAAVTSDGIYGIQVRTAARQLHTHL
jgi:UTP:GlnB (protein PII) uridylyltransferase